jgi:hypothetical protein
MDHDITSLLKIIIALINAACNVYRTFKTSQKKITAIVAKTNGYFLI